jgi:hypothetical protein
LEAFFAALAANGLAINLDKCAFGLWNSLATTFRRRDQPLAANHAAAIKSCPPQDIKQLQCFLGMVNF